MHYVRINAAAAAQKIAKTICDNLFAQKTILWLVSGGSNVAVEVATMNLLREHAGAQLHQLTILPMDERYGRPGHENSNTEQLRRAGFNPGEAKWIDVLRADTPLEQTVEAYTDIASEALARADVIIGQFGIGADGHVAGIKPGSPAAEVDGATVAGYEWEDYTRMTLTAAPLRQITTAFVVAYGADKRPVLMKLQQPSTAVAFTDFPALLLRDIPEVYIYNDQIESEGTK